MKHNYTTPLLVAALIFIVALSMAFINTGENK